MLTDMEQTRCPVCDSDDARDVVVGRDWMFPTTEEFHMVMCKSCGMHYLNPRPTANAIGSYYRSSYEPHNDVGKLRPGVRSWLRELGIRKRCRVLLKRKQSGGRLLDIGCATGAFLDAMRQTGDWEVEGVELNPNAVKLARQRGLRVVSGDFLQVSLASGVFDVVTAWDTLEHVDDPIEFLKRSWSLLKPGGLLVLRVPNLHGANRRLFGGFWAGWDLPRHLSLFPIPLLVKTLREIGFGGVETFHLSGTYADFVISTRFCLNGRGWTGYAFWNSLMGSTPVRTLLFPYTQLAELVGVGAHTTLVAWKGIAQDQ